MGTSLEQFLEKLHKEAESYTLNPDNELVSDLASGLIKNIDRYGIAACPCRLVKGAAEDNTDIICPCIYRDVDLAEYGACFCGLYVTKGVQHKQPPDRRPPFEKRREHREKHRQQNQIKKAGASGLSYDVYRCTVCGYLCAAEKPPYKCPICKADASRFELFISKD